MDDMELAKRAEARKRLEATSKATLLDLHAALNGGRLGYDGARKSKAEVVELILLAFPAETVLERLRAMPEAGAAAGKAAAAGDAASALQRAVEALLATQQRGPEIDAEAVAAIVDARLEALAVPRRVDIRVGDAAPVVLVGHQHPIFERLLRLCATRDQRGLRPNILLKGPPGCGKTHIVGQVARALGLEYGSISGSGGVSEAQLTGRLLPTGDAGRFEYLEAPFVTAYRTGGAFLLDEVDAFDPNCMVAINSALANDGFTVEARAASGLDAFVTRHPEALIVASANTFGMGADALFVGRNQLDAATLDRFIVLEMDYDRAFERTQTADQRLLEFVWALRAKVAEHRIRRVVSTRMVQRGDILLRAGVSWSETRETLLAGWTRDERSKCGVQS